MRNLLGRSLLPLDSCKRLAHATCSQALHTPGSPQTPPSFHHFIGGLGLWQSAAYFGQRADGPPSIAALWRGFAALGALAALGASWGSLVALSEPQPPLGKDDRRVARAAEKIFASILHRWSEEIEPDLTRSLAQAGPSSASSASAPRPPRDPQRFSPRLSVVYSDPDEKAAAAGDTSWARGVLRFAAPLPADPLSLLSEVAAIVGGVGGGGGGKEGVPAQLEITRSGPSRTFTVRPVAPLSPSPSSSPSAPSAPAYTPQWTVQLAISSMPLATGSAGLIEVEASRAMPWADADVAAVLSLLRLVQLAPHAAAGGTGAGPGSATAGQPGPLYGSSTWPGGRYGVSAPRPPSPAPRLRQHAHASTSTSASHESDKSDRQDLDVSDTDPVAAAEQRALRARERRVEGVRRRAAAVERLRGLGATVTLPPDQGPSSRSPSEAVSPLKAEGGAGSDMSGKGGQLDLGHIDWGDLAGYGPQKQAVYEAIILPLRFPHVLKALAEGTRGGTCSPAPRAVLFEGPPGTGKTSTARVLAGQVGVPLVYLPVESIGSKWYGESEKTLAEVFRRCEDLGPCLLFLDELDSLATSRGAGAGGEMHEATRRVLGVLLRSLDGFDALNSIVIGATNRVQDLDAALVSRFGLTVPFGLPDAATRGEILGRYARHLPPSDRASLAALSEGLSGRDLKSICEAVERRWAAKLVASGEYRPVPLGAAHAESEPDGGASGQEAPVPPGKESRGGQGSGSVPIKLPPLEEYREVMRAMKEARSALEA